MKDQDELRDETLKSLPIDQNCIFCEGKCNDFIGLVNGSRIHPACYVFVADKVAYSRLEVGRINTQKLNLRRDIQNANSFFGKLKNTFRVKKVIVSQIEEQLETLDSELGKQNDTLAKYKQKLFYVHSFWGTYPPDWEDRKNKTRERAFNSCESCGLMHGEQHIHHKTPIAKGGTHLLSNLECICVQCHSSAHGGRNVSTNDRVIRKTTKSAFQKKIDEIHKAIDQGEIVRFGYRKYDGDKSVRAISPEGLKKVGKSLCVYGYCYLRKENRTFAIRRMKNLKLTDSPGRCYYR